MRHRGDEVFIAGTGFSRLAYTAAVRHRDLQETCLAVPRQSGIDFKSLDDVPLAED